MDFVFALTKKSELWCQNPIVLSSQRKMVKKVSVSASFSTRRYVIGREKNEKTKARVVVENFNQ